jgi:hypothetical protein
MFVKYLDEILEGKARYHFPRKNPKTEPVEKTRCLSFYDLKIFFDVYTVKRSKSNSGKG